MIHKAFGHASTDEYGRFTRVDRFTCALLGYEPQALLARSVHDVTHPEDWAFSQPLLRNLFAQDESLSLTKRCLHRDGSMVWVQIYVSLLRDAAGRASFSALVRPVLPAAARPPAPGPAVGPRDMRLLRAWSEDRPEGWMN